MLTFLMGPYGLLRSEARARFASRVGAALGRLVEVESAPTYRNLIGLFGKGQAHFAWLPPAIYARCAQRYDAQLLLCGVRGRRANYRGCLFVRSDASARSVEDLAGAKVGWVDPLSAAGYLFPRLALVERGVDPDNLFAERRFLEDHPSVVRAVQTGTVDVGATFVHFGGDGDDAEILGAGWEPELARDAMRPLCVGPPIPADALVAASHVERATVLRFAECLQSMHDTADGRALLRDLFGVERFEPGLPSRYAVVTRALDAG